MKAILKNYRQSPRKVRVVADIVRGKKASDALTLLSFKAKRPSSPLKKLLESALANAKQEKSLEANQLTVSEIRVDGGTVMKRMMPRARGAAAIIKKRTSHVILVLKEISSNSGKKETKEVKKVK